MGAADNRWEQVKSLFDALLDQPAEHHDALIAAAGLQADAEAELRTLLRHHAEATDGGHFLAEPVARVSPVVPAARVGQRLGSWSIVRTLGEGGMGEVFEARRADGSYEGRAAVKLLKRGMDSAAVLQRFAQERNALARLNHPHIARLLDAGASSEGQPYFVMEYVDGRPIHDAALGLPLDQRLRLFLQLADAVAHAHRNLLVHRDLKPSNVLVDGEGQVKLLDFGIAKALDPLEGGDPGVTQAGERPYTPHYASPEQVRGEPVTTATDIYSLGVLLYQMLTGARPTGRSATTAAEAVKCVLEEAPTRPSRLSAAASLDPQWEHTRRRLEGDLDHILLKALEKTVDRRYVSVDALAEDVRCFLEGRPVSARAPSAGYVLQKFLRRNRGPVVAAVVGGVGLFTGLAATLLQGRVAAALGVLGLAGGLGLALMQAQRARTALGRADEQLGHVKELLRGLVLRYSYGVWLTPKGSGLMRNFVEDSLPRLERALAAAPQDVELQAIGADLYSRLAEMLGSYTVAVSGADVTAQRAGERAVALGVKALPAMRRDGAFVARIATARMTLATQAQMQGQPADGVVQLQLALREVDASLAEQGLPAASRAFLRGARGSLFMRWGQMLDHGGNAALGQPDEALSRFTQALAEFQQFLADEEGIAAATASAPEDDMDTAASVEQAVGYTRLSMAMVHLGQGRLAEAQAEAAPALELFERLVRDFPPNIIFTDGVFSAGNLAAHVAVRLGDTAYALRAATATWGAVNQLVASEGAASKWGINRPWAAVWYGASLHLAGRHDEAASVLDECAAHWQAQVVDAPASPTAHRSARRAAQSFMFLAQARRALGDASAAADALARADAVMALAGEPPQRTAEWLTAMLQLRSLQAQAQLGSEHAAQADALARELLAQPLLATDQRQAAAAWQALTERLSPSSAAP